jgi:hypothetical protein
MTKTHRPNLEDLETIATSKIIAAPKSLSMREENKNVPYAEECP